MVEFDRGAVGQGLEAMALPDVDRADRVPPGRDGPAPRAFDPGHGLPSMAWGRHAGRSAHGAPPAGGRGLRPGPAAAPSAPLPSNSPGGAKSGRLMVQGEAMVDRVEPGERPLAQFDAG